MSSMVPTVPVFGVSGKRSRSAAKAPAKQAVAVSERQALLENEPFDTEDPDEIVREIDKLWREAQSKFIAIGRWLCKAFREHEGTYEEAIVSRLPFGRIVAYQLRMVAEAIESHRLPVDVMPRSYSTAYKLVTLTPEDYQAALDQNLVRPDVTRAEVEEWKRARAKARAPKLAKRQRLAQERVTIRTEIAELEARLAKARQRLHEIASEIGPEEGEGLGAVIDGVAEAGSVMLDRSNMDGNSQSAA
jgi:hypothetical protein